MLKAAIERHTTAAADEARSGPVANGVRLGGSVSAIEILEQGRSGSNPSSAESHDLKKVLQGEHVECDSSSHTRIATLGAAEKRHGKT